MPRRIHGDHKEFRDIYSGKIKKEISKFINNGKLFRLRGKNVIPITSPRIDIPHFVHGRNNKNGLGRGEGNEGDIIGRDDGKGNKPGEEHQDGVIINIDLEEILMFLKDELQLPDLKPKDSSILEEKIIRYNDIGRQGIHSLIDKKRTIKEAMKRIAASGELGLKFKPPGFAVPIPVLSPINKDLRYRKYKEITIPSTNAVIFFIRDASGSMDQIKCDIVSDISWWIDLWIRSFYKNVTTNYIVHDASAQEVDQKAFYKYRFGGGTICSSGLELAQYMIKNRFPVEKNNIYIFYFTDGENYSFDNEKFVNIIKEYFNPDKVNLMGLVQVLAYQYENSLKQMVDSNIDFSNIRTTAIVSNRSVWDGGGISNDERDAQVKAAIIDILGNKKNQSK